MPGSAGTRDAPDPCFSPQDEGRARRRAGLFRPPDAAAEADEVHISVAFTYDKMFADHLAEQWKHVAPVKLGGPAYCDRGELDFVLSIKKNSMRFKDCSPSRAGAGAGQPVQQRASSCVRRNARRFGVSRPSCRLHRSLNRDYPCGIGGFRTPEKA